jgi:two-component system CheB/CheR fusion protein
MKTLRPNFIVGIGGSAGGLKAYEALLDAMPPKTGMAFVIIAHLMPSASSQLAQILSRHTKMPVKVALEGMSIHKNHVYIIPPDADLLIENYKFQVVSPRTKKNNQIDLFLTSLAEAMGQNSIGIILSGYDGDGSEGCRQIKEKRGITFSQDITAEVNVMPLSAQATDCVDFVLPPDAIAKALFKISKNAN